MAICLTAFPQMPKKIKLFDRVAVSNTAPPVGQNRNTNCIVDTILLTSQADIDNFATNYAGCTTPNYLIIDGSNAIPAITQLNGLTGITEVVHNIRISYTAIPNLNALNNLTSIGDSLILERNDVLTSIGLSNLTTLGGLYCSHLPSLNSLAGLSDQLHKTGFIYLDSTNVADLSGLQNIDSLTRNNGGLTIKYSPILDLSDLTQLKYIEGYLILSNNPLQTSTGLTGIESFWGFLIDGLPNLSSVAGLTTSLTNTNLGTFWFFNTGIAQLTGLEGLTNASNFYISGNPNLTSLNGLQNLSDDIGGGISIWGNNNLTDISALSNITGTTSGTIEISYNGIATLDGLNNVTDIGRGLWLAGNGNLTSLSALNNNLVIHNNGDPYNFDQKDSVRIYDNYNLAICSDTSICYYLSGGGTAFINNNAPGCNTIGEIEFNCTGGPNYNDLEDNCCTYNAIPIAQGETKYGNVGHYVGVDFFGDPIYDDADTYQFILPFDGAFYLNVTAKNDSSCFETTSTYLDVAVLDENVSTQQYQNLFYWSETDSCNTSFNGSYKFRGYRGDTLYFQFYGNKISYNFDWEAVDSTTTGNEFDNTIETAIDINELQTAKGNVRFKNQNYHNKDIYKTVLPVSANIDVYLKITNRENQFTNPTFRFNFSWGNNNGINFSNVNFVNLANIDETIYDTLHICALAKDTQYFRIQSFQEAYEYEWSYKIIDTLVTETNEPNNSFATASSIVADQVSANTIGFIQARSSDNQDYFRTVIPSNGTLKLMVEASTNKCDAGNLIFYGYSKNQTLTTSKTIANNNNIQPNTTVFDTISICGLPKDTFYFRFNANTAFEYQFKYSFFDTLPTIVDPETNNSFATATAFNANDSITASIKFPQGAGTDDYDYYKTVLPADGTVKIIVQAKNFNCTNGYLNLFGFDRRGASGQIFNNQIGNSFAIPQGQTIFDTLIFCGRAADTLYLRFEGVGKFIYSFKYEIIDTSTNDIEPNNNFSTALPTNENQTQAGHVKYASNGSFDDADYYATKLPNDGTIKIVVQATNMSCSNNQWIYLYGYDSRKGSGNIFEKYVANNSSVAAGQTIYDTIQLCGRAVDSFYLRFIASGAFKYQWSYEMTNTGGNDVEPNNDFTTALLINETEQKVGHVKYASNGIFDENDYYKTKLPKDGTIKLMVQATNISCNNNQWIYVHGYDNRKGSGQIFEKYIADNSSVAAGQTIYDTIFLCGRAVDSFYLRIRASGAFNYQWSYVMVDTSINDIEPNNNFTTAIGVGSNQTKYGHIKYSANGSRDDLDYYKFVYTADGNLKINMQATNQSCSNNQWLYLRVYDKNFNQLFQRYFANNGTVSAGQSIIDSIELAITAPQTIYLRFEASNAFNYQLSTNPRLPASNFTITGDSTSCFGTQTFVASNVYDNDVTYNWVLSGGGSLSFTDSIATVNWNSNGNHTLSLYLSSSFGNSETKQKTITVNNNAPTEVPVLLNSSRTLSTSGLPVGTVCQWYKSGVVIPNFTESIYYAADSGTYTVRFVRACGIGPASNPIQFALPAQAQTIQFNHTANIVMAPIAKAKLNATSSSGLPVSYQLISGNATINGDSISVTSVGTVIVKAIQQGSDVFAPAVPKFDTILVVQGSQSIVFNTIPDQIYSSTPFTLTASSSSGLVVSYSIVSGNASINGNQITATGLGTVTVQANQPGNLNYSAATSVQQSFCIGVRTLNNIIGSNTPCINSYIYTTDKIPGANYVWTLDGGGTFTTAYDTAFINWTTPGTHTITVKANGTCDPTFSNTLVYVITTNNNAPTVVSNMLPANNAINQQLPLTLSWQPGAYTISYDVYVWDSAQAQPVVPFISDINAINFTLPQNSFAYNTTYKWQVVSKNPCLSTSGPIQTFRLIPLPDLEVTQILAPASAFSGQSININWTVKNNGPGNTQTNQNWIDAVYLSFDSIPNFTIPAQTSSLAWSQVSFPIRPLLIGTRPNVSALDSGQSYSNSIPFTLPINYSQPLYVYVITNNPPNSNLPQVTYVNDTAKAAQPIIVTLSPTPDLRVDTVLTPSSLFSGSTFNLTYKVKNYGAVTPPASRWSDKFYISPTANFNPATAIPLKIAKLNEQYYCNAIDGEILNNSGVQLNTDSSVTGSISVVIPNFIYGAYFIHAFTNANNTLYEGALSDNNTNSKQVQIYLTPTPVLEVSQLNVPYTNVSTTQPLGINWKIYNAGIFDNIEKNQGHHAKKGVYCGPILTGYTPPPANQPIYADGYYYTDSLGWGSSYWNEKIYISKDSGNINTANLIYLGKFDHGTAVSQAPCFDYLFTCLPQGNNDRNIHNVIKPTLNYPSNSTITLPDTLSAGNYYVYVLANADKTVYEYPAIKRYQRSNMIAVTRPDLTVTAISAPASTNAGVPVTVNYTVTNISSGGLYNRQRKDVLYTSTSPVFNASAQIVQTQTFVENVLPSAPVQHTFTYTFPPSTPTSVRYFYVQTNYDSAFKETTLINNYSNAVAINVSIANEQDLLVTDVQLPDNLTDTVFTLTPIKLKYTVSNNGADSIDGKNWVDSIFVSCTPTFNVSTAFYLTKRLHNNTLAPGESYSDSFTVTVPKFSYQLNNCFGIDNTPAYFFVRTNADSSVYEGANMVNNYTAAAQKKFINPYIDLTVTNVSGADTVAVARFYSNNWTVKNIKYFTDYGYPDRTDAIYFSPDSVLNANAIQVHTKNEVRRLASNQSYPSTDTYILPNMPAGDYYVHANTNAYRQLPVEKNYTNNSNLIRDINGVAKKIHVNATALPDLTAQLLSPPTLLSVGQSYPLSYVISNEGVGVTFPNQMNTVVYLSTTPSPGGKVLQQTIRNTPLQQGNNFTNTVVLNLPASTIPGNYYLLVYADNNQNIIELNENNNYAYIPVTVFAPAASDLYVQSVQHADTVYLGYPIDSIQWIVSNISSNPARGLSSDGIYLSTSNELDSTATLIDIKQKDINMLPLSNDTLRTQSIITNVTEGNYTLFVKTDFLNNIVENNKANNVTASTNPLYVKVKELPLSIPTANTLAAIPRFYKLIIPDSLNGATILVRLTSNDSLSSTNQLYIGKNYIPSAARFDFKYDKPNFGNQQIVITTATPGVYYIRASKITATSPNQSITLSAVKLPFAILSVQTNSGGNTGNVTIKISGSLFNNSMLAKLYNGSTTIPAIAVYYVNTTTVFATFNLQGKPLGIYHVGLHKTTDSTDAILSNGFSIVPANNGGLITGGGINSGAGDGNQPGCDPGAASGLNSQLVEEIVLPPVAFGGWPFVIQINYNNPTNVDIPAQTRVIYCTDGFPIAFTVAGLNTAGSSLYLQISEDGGPPGIIRAGGSGTITIYSKPPVDFPAHRYGNYILR
ncbi:MAG: CARDB domain-containing protein [Ferruginibacter sp.]